MLPIFGNNWFYQYFSRLLPKLWTIIQFPKCQWSHHKEPWPIDNGDSPWADIVTTAKQSKSTPCAYLWSVLHAVAIVYCGIRINMWKRSNRKIGFLVCVFYNSLFIWPVCCIFFYFPRRILCTFEHTICFTPTGYVIRHGHNALVYSSVTLYNREPLPFL